MNTRISRRGMLRQTGAGMAGFAGLQALFHGPLGAQQKAGYGDLVADAAQPALLDLPPGFRYHAFSRTGDALDDGLRVPGAHDGMAAFAGANGRTILVRNHEMNAATAAGVAETPGSPYFGNAASYGRIDRTKVYDSSTGARPALGGTVTLVYNTSQRKLERHFLSLTGTIRNCAGGPTPWGSWITCEETTLVEGAEIGEGVRYRQNHGYVFEVPAKADSGLVTPVPLKALGRFTHEALAIDTRTGIVYETEDDGSGLFYRFLPNERGNLRAGGKLQALKLANGVAVTSNRVSAQVPVGKKLAVEWADLDRVELPEQPLKTQGAARGAAQFSRGEGCWFGNNTVYFACTDGGAAKLGQIFKYTPSRFEGRPNEHKEPGTLELFVEPKDDSQFAAPDNIALAPWGDLVVCKDGSGTDYVYGVTPQGQAYKIARNAFNDSEFAGACFSPDGSTLFVNMQVPGITFAITGPWKRGRA